MGPARRDRIVRRGNVARGEGRDSQPGVARGLGKNPPSSAAASMAALAASRAALGSPWYASIEGLHGSRAAPPVHVVSRVGLGNDLAQLRDGSNQITGHPLCHTEIPPAATRGVPVTDGVGEVASFFGGRAYRDRITRHDRPERLPDSGSG